MRHPETTSGKRRVVILSMLILLLFSCFSSLVYADDSQPSSGGSNLVSEKNLENATGEDSKEIQEIEENVKNYDLDKKEAGMLEDAGGNVGQWLASVLYKASRGMGYYSAYLTKFCMDFDLFKTCQSTIQPLIEDMEGLTMNTIQGGVGMLFIAFTLAMVVFLIVKGQTAQGMGRLVQIVAVFVLAAFFFTAPFQAMSQANQIAKDVGTSIYEAVQGENSGTAADQAVATIWETMAETPWLLLEFDDATSSIKKKVDNQNTEEYNLKHLAPEDEERQESVEALSEEYRPLQEGWSAQSDRIGAAFFMLLMNLVLFIINLAITIFILGLQVLTLLMGVLAPIVFLMALFPSKGIGVIRNWALVMLLAYMGITIGLFGFGIYLLLVDFVYGSLIATLGYFLCFVIMLAFVIMVFLFRRKILGIFGDTSSLDRLESRAERQIMRHYMRNQRRGGSLPIRGAKKLIGASGSGLQAASSRVSHKFDQTEMGKNIAARKFAKQADLNAQKQDWQDDVNERASDMRNYYSQREQEENQEELRRKQTETQNQRTEPEQTEAQEKKHPAKPGNIRDQVRKQQVETGEERRNGMWKKDANGVPYRVDSTVGKSLRDQVKESAGQSMDSSGSVTTSGSMKPEGVRHEGNHGAFHLYDERPATARANRPEMMAEKAVPARKEAVKPVQAESKADTSSRPQLRRQRKASATKKATSNGSRPTIHRKR